MVKQIILAEIKKLWPEFNTDKNLVFDGELDNQGDIYTSAPLIYAKDTGESPLELAKKSAEFLKNSNELKSIFEKIEPAAPGFVNFYYSVEFLQKELEKIANDEEYGTLKVRERELIMVEFTDPNPFKLFHIGHLMSNTIGESISRLYEASGAKVIRVNYQGDVGLHVAKSIWGIKNVLKTMPAVSASLREKVGFLNQGYAAGTVAYQENEHKSAIDEVNRKIYSREDVEINTLYDEGKKWSLEYFEEIYKKLGTKFDEYFFESETGKDGLKIVQKHKEIFKESEGAVIFEGEKYGLHNRVFINSQSLPTYEAKELGLNKKKFELHPNLHLSIIVTGNEIVDYFRVLLKVMEFVIPDVATKTRHVAHGMLRLPSGKISSRNGDVITAESLIQQVREKIKAKAKESDNKSGSEDNSEDIAIGAIKYSILKQSPGKDIVFDFAKSLSLDGDSGPYIQYAYARLQSILSRAGDHQFSNADYKKLEHKSELDLIKHLLRFTDTVESSAANLAPHHIALYTYQLASLANNFYEKIRVLDDENKERVSVRLALIKIVAQTISRGLDILGIKSLNKI